MNNPCFLFRLPWRIWCERGKQKSTGQPSDELFSWKARTLLSGDFNLKKIIEKFSEFSKMPKAQFQLVHVMN